MGRICRPRRRSGAPAGFAAPCVRIIEKAHRVLEPGGRLVFGALMFTVALSDARDGVGTATGRSERPARAERWETALGSVGFTDITVEVLAHEGGITAARLLGRTGATGPASAATQLAWIP